MSTSLKPKVPRCRNACDQCKTSKQACSLSKGDLTSTCVRCIRIGKICTRAIPNKRWGTQTKKVSLPKNLNSQTVMDWRIKNCYAPGTDELEIYCLLLLSLKKNK